MLPSNVVPRGINRIYISILHIYRSAYLAKYRRESRYLCRRGQT